MISYDEKVSAIKVLTCIKGILHISRKYPYPPQGKLLKILKGRGASKANIFKRLFEAKLEFPEGCEGSDQTTFSGRGINGYFLEKHIAELLCALGGSIPDVTNYCFPNFDG